MHVQRPDLQVGLERSPACSIRLDAAASNQVLGVQHVDQMVSLGGVQVIQHPAVPIQREARENIDNRAEVAGSHAYDLVAKVWTGACHVGRRLESRRPIFLHIYAPIRRPLKNGPLFNGKRIGNRNFHDMYKAPLMKVL